MPGTQQIRRPGSKIASPSTVFLIFPFQFGTKGLTIERKKNLPSDWLTSSLLSVPDLSQGLLVFLGQSCGLSQHGQVMEPTPSENLGREVNTPFLKKSKQLVTCPVRKLYRILLFQNFQGYFYFML